MIQRIQTLWLILAAAAALLTFQWPLFLANAPAAFKFMATDKTILLFVQASVATIAAIDIFLFSNRKLQLRLAIVGIVVSILSVVAEFYFISRFKTDNMITEGYWYLGAVFPLLAILFFILAARGIYKDDKLVKSLDRLR